MLHLVVFLAAALAVQGQTTAVNSTAVNRCISNSGELPISVYIDNCETPPCQLPQLQDFVANITFRTPRPLERMTTLASVFFGNLLIPIPYDLGANAVTCNFLQNTSCPVSEGEVIVYQLKMSIESIFPINSNINLEFSVVDPSNDSAIMCIRVPILVVPPVTE